MQEQEPKAPPNGDAGAEINMSRIRVGGGVPGLIFAVGTVYIFVVGVPVVRGFFMWSLIAGALISLGLHVFHTRQPARPGSGMLDLSTESTPPMPEAKRVRRIRGFRPFQVDAVSIG